MIQILNPSGTPSHFPTQQPSGVTTFPPAAVSFNKPARIPSSVPSDQSSVSSSVSVILYPSLLTSTAPTTLPTDVRI